MKLFPLYFLAALASPAPAATIVVTKGPPGTTLGLQLANYFTGSSYTGGGYYISVGTFPEPPTVPSDLLGYREFAASLSPTSGAAQGYISGSFTGIPLNPGDFNSKEIYLVAGNGLTLASSSEQVVLRGSGIPWLFPADTTAASATTISLAGAASVFGTAINGMVTLVVDLPTGPDQVMMAPLGIMPEPGTTVLLLTGLMGCCRRSRIA